MASASYGAVVAIKRRILEVWSRTERLDAALALAEDDALRARLVVELRAEVESGDRDPEVIARRGEEQARDEASRRYARLLSPATAEPPGSTVVWHLRAYFAPAFHTDACVCSSSRKGRRRGGSPSSASTVRRSMCCSIGPATPSPRPRGEWLARCPPTSSNARGAPWTRSSRTHSSTSWFNGRDGIRVIAEVMGSVGPSHFCEMWCPWDPAPDGHVLCLDLLFELSRTSREDVSVAAFLAGVDRYRRSG